jgi:phospholipid/cholesterol/gamma-HCH transport system permease protein
MPSTLNETAATFELRAGDDGSAVLFLHGRLDVNSTATVWHDLEKRLRASQVNALEVDASGVEHLDGAGFALLKFLEMGGMTPRAGTVAVRGLRPEMSDLLEKLSRQDYEENRPQEPERIPVAEEVGRTAVELARDVKEEVEFLGEMSADLAASLARPRRMRWNEVWRVFEVAGVNALPIISLISLLVGLIIAFGSAQPFAMFGAQIFIANMIGIIMARELGPLMTGIILAGRTGSAFAAELGTMKVNEELNALETMGLNPMRFLVVQRVVAGVLLTPLLSVYSILLGIVGGALVMMGLGFSLDTIYHQMAQTLHARDVIIGVSKGTVFGVLVAGVGCLRGMQTGKGPSAVGESATRAVVSGILLVILADAVFAVVLFALNL